MTPERTFAGHARIHKWWISADEAADPSEAGDQQRGQQQQQLCGKPSVFARKTVNTGLEDGRTVAVNAQQYAVLVMDVPDLRLQQSNR